jgi:ATP-dependent Lon protease
LADGEVLADIESDKDAQLELVRKVVQALETSPEIGRNIPRSAINQFSKGVNPAELADSLAGYLDIPMDQKQAVLAEPDINKRLELILKLLSASQEMAKIDENLQEKVRESAEKSQKEYFLREKMKAIKEELGEGQDGEESEDAIKDKLNKNPYPDNVKAKVKSELHRYEMMPESSLEASLIMTYIDTLMGAPWYQKTEDNEDLKTFKRSSMKTIMASKRSRNGSSNIWRSRR